MFIFIVHPRNVFSHYHLLQKFTNTKLFSTFSNKSFFHIHTSVSILEGQWCVLFRAHTPASKLSPTDVTNSVISEEPGFKPDMWVPWVHERNFKIEQQRKTKKLRHKILFRLEFWKQSVFFKGLEIAWVGEPD